MGRNVKNRKVNYELAKSRQAKNIILYTTYLPMAYYIPNNKLNRFLKTLSYIKILFGKMPPRILNAACNEYNKYKLLKIVKNQNIVSQN